MWLLFSWWSHGFKKLPHILFPIQVLGNKKKSQTNKTEQQRKQQQNDKGRRKNPHQESKSFHLQQTSACFPRTERCHAVPLGCNGDRKCSAFCFVLLVGYMWAQYKSVFKLLGKKMRRALGKTTSLVYHRKAGDKSFTND